MNTTYTMTEVIAELVNRFPNVGSTTGKEKDGDKTEGKAGELGFRKRQLTQRLKR